MKEKIIFDNLPRHIAIIMDGNGRWAEKRNLGRIEGHKKGIDSLRNILKSSLEFGIKYLTVFAFSSENWQRPKKEVDSLMHLLEHYISSELPMLIKNKINFNIIGNIEKIPYSAKKNILNAIDKTSGFNDIFLVLALSYGAREEIIASAAKIASDFKEGKLKNLDSINDDIFSSYLYTKNIPDPDLLIRTGGEERISNFLLFQLAYTELYFTKTMWPDFGRKNLISALKNYEKRIRRFGKIKV
jgi:undecaprenyl diphosphate synthase